MPAPADDVPDEERPADQATDRTVAHAAALDDCLGGFATDGPLPADVDAELPGLLDAMLLLRQAAAADGVTPQAAPSAMPRSIGRHAILRRAGEGGFATVWEGFDTVLRRPVAVKVRRPEMLLSEAARRRFVREAEIAARLVHPHLVTIFEVGEDEGREFIAAEFCPGGSLADWLARHPGPLPPRDAARLVRALAGAVAAAHAGGVIHRDIKPANVLLAPAPRGMEPLLRERERLAAESGGFTVKLGDFGLGKLQKESGGVEPLTQLTRTGTSIGTPAWMAPEQIDRSFGPVGPATDVHALGLLLDRLLTGRALRGGGTDAETYREVLLDEPPFAATVVRGVPRDLAAVAARCLAKQPHERYPTADDLGADLDRWLDGRPTRARPISLVGQGLRQVRRRPVVVGLASVALVACLVAGWAGVERLRSARASALQEADLRRQRASAELRRGFEALRAGNVAGALAQLETTRGIDAPLADSLAGRWLVRRTHGEQEILLAPPPAAESRTVQPRDLYAIALAPDGRTAAVAGADGAVRLVRGLDATAVVQTISAHDEVNDVCFSADGSLLATAGQDGRLRWWHVGPAGLEPAGATTPDAGPLYAAAFAPDGRSLAIGGEDRVVRLVRLDEPDRPVDLFRFEKPAGKSPEVESIVFLDASTLAASCGDLIVLLEVATGRLVREFARPAEGNRNAVFGSLTVSPDGTLLMACGTDAAAHVWDIATGRIVRSFAEHPAWVQGCGFAPDGTTVATACRDGGVRVFDVASGRLLERLLGHVGRVWSVVYEPSGMLLTAGADGTVRRWDPRVGFEAAAMSITAVSGGEILMLGAGLRPEAVIAANRTGQVMAIDVGGDAGSADTFVANVRWQRSGPDEIAIWQAAFDRQRGRLATSFHPGARVLQILLLDEADHSPARSIPLQLPPGVDPAEAIPCWTPGGELVVRTADGGLFWYAADLADVHRIGTLAGTVHALAAAPAGPPRVAAIGDRAVIHPLPASPSDPGGLATPLVLALAGETTAVAWSPDATTIACGTRTGAVHLFDAASGASQGVLAVHERTIEALAFAPDGRILLAADRDRVRLSDTATLTTFDELWPGIEIRGMCLTADTKRLVLGGAAAASAAAPPAAVPEAAVPKTGEKARLAVMELRTP